MTEKDNDSLKEIAGSFIPGGTMFVGEVYYGTCIIRLPRQEVALLGIKHRIIPNNMLILFGIMDII